MSIFEGRFLDADILVAVKELQRFAAELSQAGASTKAINMAASPHMLRNKGYTLDIVRVGAALYGQQETVPGTRSAARWLSRVVSLKKVSAHEVSSKTVSVLHCSDGQLSPLPAAGWSSVLMHIMMYKVARVPGADGSFCKLEVLHGSSCAA